MFNGFGFVGRLSFINLPLYGAKNEFLIPKSAVDSIEILDEWLIGVAYIIANFVLGLNLSIIVSSICDGKLRL